MSSRYRQFVLVLLIAPGPGLGVALGQTATISGRVTDAASSASVANNVRCRSARRSIATRAYSGGIPARASSERTSWPSTSGSATGAWRASR